MFTKTSPVHFDVSLCIPEPTSNRETVGAVPTRTLPQPQTKYTNGAKTPPVRAQNSAQALSVAAPMPGPSGISQSQSQVSDIDSEIVELVAPPVPAMRTGHPHEAAGFPPLRAAKRNSLKTSTLEKDISMIPPNGPPTVPEVAGVKSPLKRVREADPTNEAGEDRTLSPLYSSLFIYRPPL